MVDTTTLVNNYVIYVFGDVVLTALAFLFIITLIGVRYGWGLEAFVVVLTPTLLVIAGPTVLPPGIEPLYLMGLGLIIGFGLLALIRR